jgi:DNA modification methylase
MTSPVVNQVLAGDCLDVLLDLPDGIADLVYLDPPFNTGKTQVSTRARYPDHWPDMASYLAFMQPRVRAIHRSLKPDGSILLHCDWRTCHHFRLMLDEIFGVDRFVNHLIWRYGLGGSSPRRFARKHDDILFYARSDGYYFLPPMVPSTSNRMKGLHKKAGDVLDVPSINNMAVERAGYPTQKPVALLELLVNACCPQGGLVLDPFCGSGTTLVAALKCNCRFIGVDVNPNAVQIAQTRCSMPTPVS